MKNIGFRVAVGFVLAWVVVLGVSAWADSYEDHWGKKHAASGTGTNADPYIPYAIMLNTTGTPVSVATETTLANIGTTISAVGTTVGTMNTTLGNIGTTAAASLALHNTWDATGRVEVSGMATTVTGSLTRGLTTTAYANGQLICTTTVAGNCAPITLTVGRTSSGSGASGALPKLACQTSLSTWTGSITAHAFATTTTVANGDGGAFLPNNSLNYVGAWDGTFDRQCTDGVVAMLSPRTGSFTLFTGQVLYFYLESRSTQTPVASQTFQLSAPVINN